MINKQLGFMGLLNLALIILKLCNVVTISWWILTPIMIAIAALPWIIRFLFIYWINK